MVFGKARGILAIGFVLAGCSLAEAAVIYTPVTFDYNSFNGRDTNYPTGLPVTLGGVPFDIPTGPLNAWDSVGGSGSVSLTIPVNVKGVFEVDTLINTSWGVNNQQYTSLTFNWSGGLSTVINLTDGVDIRDWWQGGYANTINGTTSVQVYSGTGAPSPYYPTRVDKQQFDFSAAQYADRTLETIVLTDWGSSGISRAFLYGVTVASDVPSPGVIWLLFGGLFSLAVTRRRFKR